MSVVCVDHEHFGDEIESRWNARANELYMICWDTNNKQAVIKETKSATMNIFRKFLFSF